MITDVIEQTTIIGKGLSPDPKQNKRNAYFATN